MPSARGLGVPAIPRIPTVNVAQNFRTPARVSASRRNVTKAQDTRRGRQNASRRGRGFLNARDWSTDRSARPNQGIVGRSRRNALGRYYLGDGEAEDTSAGPGAGAGFAKADGWYCQSRQEQVVAAIRQFGVRYGYN